MKFEGTNIMQESRLQLLTTKFENLHMQQDETIGQYHARVCDISNEAFASRVGGWG